MVSLKAPVLNMCNVCECYREKNNVLFYLNLAFLCISCQVEYIEKPAAKSLDTKIYFYNIVCCSFFFFFIKMVNNFKCVSSSGI